MAVKKLINSRGRPWEMTIKVDGRLVRRRFATKKQADDEYSRLREAGRTGTFIAPADARITVAEYAEIWLSGVPRRPSTQAKYRNDVINHINPVLGGYQLGRVRRQDVSKLVATLVVKPLAPSTVKQVYKVLSMIFRSAVYDRRVTSSPCFKVGMPENTAGDLLMFAISEVPRLLAAAKPRHYAFFVTLIATGLRQGELLGLTVDRIDFLRRELTVNQQLVTPATAGRPYLTPLLKSSASRRVLPLPAYALEALAEHIRVFGTGEDGLLFTNPSWRGWRRGSFNGSVWNPTLRRAGLSLDYGCHAGRHFYASGLIAEGQNIRVVMERMGHASIRETADTYGHLFADAHGETILALERLYDKIVRSSEPLAEAG
jgi:integrase